MASFNRVILMGNLTRDPELRYTPKGMAIAKITVAANRKWKSEATGEMMEEVTFVDVDAFGKNAETIGNYLKKGSPLLVEGRLRLDSWEDKQTGQKRSRLGVVLESFRFLDSGRSRDSASEGGGGTRAAGGHPAHAAAGATGAAAASDPAHDAPDDMPPEDDDVPF